MASRYFGKLSALKKHLVARFGKGVAGEVADLRRDVETAFSAQQAEAAKDFAARPATPYNGQMCFDTAWQKPIWWSAGQNIWVFADGTSAMAGPG